MRKAAHITIAGQPFCGWLGCQAGRDKANAVARANSNIQPSDVTCGHRTVKGARRIAQALRPHFRPGLVAVVVGDCPDLPQ